MYIYCDICNLHLCKTCVGEHLFDESTEHKLEEWGPTTKCPKHFKKYVNVYVKNEAFLFVLCVSFEEHQTHDVHGHFGKLKKQEPCLTKRFTRFREISFFKISRDCCLHTSSKCISEWRKLTQRNRHHYTENEIWLAEIEAKYMAPLKKKEKERTCTIFEIAMNITDLKKLLNSNNASLVSPYKSRNVKFRKLPLILTISLTSFIPKK